MYSDMFHSHFQESTRHPVEFFSTILSPVRIEWFLKNYNVSDINTFNELLIENHYMYSFIILVDLELLEYFTLKQ
jgi:hypothetical protein